MVNGDVAGAMTVFGLVSAGTKHHGAGMSRVIAYLLFLTGALACGVSLPAAAKPVSPLDIFYTVRPEDLAGPPGKQKRVV